jgi:hypothetical protein
MALWRRVLVALTVVAVGLQSYAVQTHMHLLATAEAGVPYHDGKAPNWASRADIQRIGVPAKQNNNAPGDDSSNCPLCQEFFVAGNYVAPAAIAVLPPTLNVAPVVLETPAVSYASVNSHIWQGRAPPTV